LSWKRRGRGTEKRRAVSKDAGVKGRNELFRRKKLGQGCRHTLHEGKSTFCSIVTKKKEGDSEKKRERHYASEIKQG